MSFLIFIGILVICAPIAKAVAQRISADTELGNANAVRAALEDMEQRLIGAEQRLEDVVERISENEERLDFAERLLTRMDSQKQIKP